LQQVGELGGEKTSKAIAAVAKALLWPARVRGMAGGIGLEQTQAEWSKEFCPLGMFLQKEIKLNARFFTLDIL